MHLPSTSGIHQYIKDADVVRWYLDSFLIQGADILPPRPPTSTTWGFFLRETALFVKIATIVKRIFNMHPQTIMFRLLARVRATTNRLLFHPGGSEPKAV